MQRIEHRFFLFILAAATLMAGCEAPAADQDAPSETDAAGDVRTSEHYDYRVVTVASGIANPWSIAFLPTGETVVTERSGNLRVLRDGELLPDPVPGLPEVRTGGQGGLLDVVAHPDFESNRLLYISYAKPREDDSEGTTAVIRGTFRDDALTDVEEVFEAQAWTGGRGHHGSRLAFDDEGYLFITVGDRQARPAGDLAAHPSQDLTNHYGTVIRLNDDGSVPEDNPFVDDPDALPEIWSYGHRNPQGLAIHPETGEVWSTEHGPQGGDELNRIEAGVNYGWPVIGFGVNYGAGQPIHDAVQAEGMRNPVYHWTPSIATSGLMIYTGEQFPEWQGDVFVGGLAGQVLARVTLRDGRFAVNEFLVQGLGRVRDVRQGPDGFIYLAIDQGGGEDEAAVVRLEPAG